MHSHEALAGSLKTMVRESVAGAGELPRAASMRPSTKRRLLLPRSPRARKTRTGRASPPVRSTTLTSAVLMAWEASQSGNGKRLLLSRMILEHRLSAEDPMAMRDNRWESKAADLLLRDADVSPRRGVPLVVSSRAESRVNDCDCLGSLIVSAARIAAATVPESRPMLRDANSDRPVRADMTMRADRPIDSGMPARRNVCRRFAAGVLPRKPNASNTSPYNRPRSNPSTSGISVTSEVRRAPRVASQLRSATAQSVKSSRRSMRVAAS